MDGCYFAELFDSSFWAHRRAWAWVMQLSEEAYRQDLGYSVGSIRDQIVHTLMVEHWWFTFLDTGDRSFLDDEQLADRAAVRAQWDATEAKLHAYLGRLTPEELRREVRLEFWPAEARPIAASQTITQVANHSTDHRAQTLAGPHRLGAPTVDQDVLDFPFERQAR